MNVVVKPLEELHEAERNVRGHTPRQIAEYVRSIKRFGQMKPIVCDEHGEIVIGNGLYLALKEMGAETADCYVIEGWTEEQKLKLMLSDNKVYELGVSLDSVMQSIVREMDDVDIPGYSEDILLAIRSSVADVTSAISSYGMVSEEALRPIKAAASDDTRPRCTTLEKQRSRIRSRLAKTIPKDPPTLKMRLELRARDSSYARTAERKYRYKGGGCLPARMPL